MELYLDCAATTNVDSDVLNEYVQLVSSSFASTGSLHSLGEQSLILESNAKDKIASMLKVKPSEIYFNSGATEGNNYAIKGVALQYQKRGKTIITSKIEHPSVLECFKQLEKDYGFRCIYLDINEDGGICLNQLQESLNQDVILVSIMYVNHEVGTILQMKEISKMIRKYPKIIFHSDITQALGKVAIDFSLFDLATMSAHKIHGMKGSGFLYKKEGISLYPIISGIPLTNSLRAGTSNWQSNVVLATALKKSLKTMKENATALQQTKEKLLLNLKNIDGIQINTNEKNSIPGMINFSIVHYNAEVLVRALSNKQIYVSSKSVCSSKNKDAFSSVLKAMHQKDEIASSSIRISYDRALSDEEITYFIDSLKEILANTKKIGGR